jgi:predicted RNA-binding Zn ribbon-like protein
MALHAGNLTLLGGELCLDFVNTVEHRDGEQPLEFLRSYADLLAWSHHVGLLTSEEAQRLRQEAELRPTEAAGVLDQAMSWRETLYQIFAAASRDQPVDGEALAQLNAMLTQTFTHLQLLPRQGGFAWDWKDSVRSLDRMLWPVLRSAADLLTGVQLDRLGQCPGCGWFFVDGSRSRTRRWCDMRVCGNRAKARRHYARQRKQRADEVSDAKRAGD